MTTLTEEQANLLNTMQAAGAAMAARIEVIEAALTTSQAEVLAQRVRADGLEQASTILHTELGQSRARHDALEVSLNQAQTEFIRLQETTAAAAAGGKGAGKGSHAGVIDTRTIGKPDIFKGDKTQWKNWSVVFKGYVSPIDKGFTEDMKNAKASKDAISDGTLDESSKARSITLHYMLLMLLKDKALEFVTNEVEGNGLEVWRRLCRAYEPTLAANALGLNIKILEHQFDAVNTFASIEKWELAIRQYQDMSGLVIDDQTKMAALVKNLQNKEMKDHLIMQSASLKTYSDMRAEIERVGTIRDSMLDSSMDLSGFGKGAKGGKNSSKGDRS